LLWVLTPGELLFNPDEKVAFRLRDLSEFNVVEISAGVSFRHCSALAPQGFLFDVYCEDGRGVSTRCPQVVLPMTVKPRPLDPHLLRS
jgi:hypothetical protein